MNDNGHSASAGDFCTVYNVGNELDLFIHLSHP